MKFCLKTLILLSPILLISQEYKLGSKLVAGGFTKPLYVTSHPTDLNHLYVLEQHGKIKIIKNGTVQKSPFLDLTNQVHTPRLPGDERGLLGFALHPHFSENNRFYINYVNKKGFTIISELTSDNVGLIADPSSERVLFSLKQPFSNHNGGHLAFGLDGFLYISVGDGGKSGDPNNAGQSLNTYFGKILRIDVDSGIPYGVPKTNPFISTSEAKGEIWALGLRNVWRFSFDSETGDLYLGDVGQNKWEEINFQPGSSSGGENYGWKIMEGNHCFHPEVNCDTSGLTLPIFEYPNDANYMRTLTGMDQPEVDGCSVTGGYVYRGNKIPGLVGTYVFGDYCSGNIWSFRVKNGHVYEFQNRTTEINLGGGIHTSNISSFGQDASGELYIVDYNGEIYKLVSVD